MVITLHLFNSISRQDLYGGKILIDLSKYRIVDLSEELRPGILRLDGEYFHGDQLRRLQIREFRYAKDKTLMNFVETETHIGTHVEAPSHYIEDGRSVAELPLETFMGEAIVLGFNHKGGPKPIDPIDLQEAMEEDIVLMWSTLPPQEQPYISPEAATFLQRRKIKMIGVQGVPPEAPGSMASHEAFLRNNIPMIEGLAHLEEVKRKRVFFIGLPLRWKGIDSSWIRAIALEEI
jgi:arylformamidase